MLPHEGKHAAHSIAQEHGQPRNPALWKVNPTKTPNQFSSASCASTAKRTGLPVENTHLYSQTHMVKTTDHAALWNGGSSGVLLARAIAASSVVSPDPSHQHTHKRTEARENTKYEQQGPDAEDPSVKKTLCRDHDHTS